MDTVKEQEVTNTLPVIGHSLANVPSLKDVDSFPSSVEYFLYKLNIIYISANKAKYETFSGNENSRIRRALVRMRLLMQETKELLHSEIINFVEKKVA